MLVSRFGFGQPSKTSLRAPLMLGPNSSYRKKFTLLN